MKQRKALKTLNESFDSPVRPLRRSQARFQPYRAADMKKFKEGTPETCKNDFGTAFRNPTEVSVSTPGLSGTPHSHAGDVSYDFDPKFEYKAPVGGRLEPIRRSLRKLKSKTIGATGRNGLKLQTTPETSAAERRWVSGRPCKLAARRKIEEIVSPKR